MATVTDLPRITRYLYVQDHGPADGGKGSTVCPHCGADGRYVHHFEVESGERLAAMSGCIKLFPMSEIAREDMRLSERERELKRDYGPEAKLNSWDTKIREAINGYYEGTVTEGDVLRTIRAQKAAAAQYRQRKYGGR